MSAQPAPAAVRRGAPRRRRSLGAAVAVGLGAALLTGCSWEQWGRAGLPPPAAEQTASSTGQFWVWTWVAALVVGAIVWGLILWASFRYRKKNDDLPPQTRYNVPIEAFYTVTPFIILAALFYWEINTERVALQQNTGQAQVNIDVIGQKWAWTFNYADDVKAYDIGVSSASGNEQDLATLWLPVNERVQFRLNSPDVIHSFWVPSFYFKMDVIPGRLNTFELTPTVTGTFAGKCAELCGTYHSNMLFNVKVVPRAEYDAHLRDLQRIGQSGNISVRDVQFASGGGGESAGTGQGEGVQQ